MIQTEVEHLTTEVEHLTTEVEHLTQENAVLRQQVVLLKKQLGEANVSAYNARRNEISDMRIRHSIPGGMSTAR